MKYYAIYTYEEENTYRKSHIALDKDENAISVELKGNPYKAFETLPNRIEA